MVVTCKLTRQHRQRCKLPNDAGAGLRNSEILTLALNPRLVTPKPYTPSSPGPASTCEAWSQPWSSQNSALTRIS